MGLLGDFLMGAATQGGRDILNRTLAEDERVRLEGRQDAVHKRQREESDADYERRRKAALEDAERMEKTRLRLQSESAAAAEQRTMAKQMAGAGASTLASTPGLLQSELAAVQKGQNPFTNETADESGGHSAPDEKRFMAVMSTYNKALAQTMTGVSPKALAEADRVTMKNNMIAAGDLEGLRKLERAEAGKGRYELNAQGTIDHDTQTFTPKPDKGSGGGPTPYQITRDARADVAEARRELARADGEVEKIEAKMEKARTAEKAALAVELKTAKDAQAAAAAEVAAAKQQVPSLNPNKKPLLSGAAGATTAPPPPAPPPAAPKIDMAKANAIKKQLAEGRLTREEAVKQLKALGFQ